MMSYFAESLALSFLFGGIVGALVTMQLTHRKLATARDKHSDIA